MNAYTGAVINIAVTTTSDLNTKNNSYFIQYVSYVVGILWGRKCSF
jgi:hypothetical protein